MMKTKTMIVAAVIGAALAAIGAASAAGVTSSLFGGAAAQPADVSLTSDLTDASTANDFSGIKFTVPAGTTFAQLWTLSTEFDPTVGGCGGGAPRFSIQLASGKNVFVYLGPSPSFTGCTLNTWQSTGNLIGNNDIGRYDTSQVQPGTQSSTYAAALALVGSQQVAESTSSSTRAGSSLRRFRPCSSATSTSTGRSSTRRRAQAAVRGTARARPRRARPS